MDLDIQAIYIKPANGRFSLFVILSEGAKTGETCPNRGMSDRAEGSRNEKACGWAKRLATSGTVQRSLDKLGMTSFCGGAVFERSPLALPGHPPSTRGGLLRHEGLLRHGGSYGTGASAVRGLLRRATKKPPVRNGGNERGDRQKRPVLG